MLAKVGVLERTTAGVVDDAGRVLAVITGVSARPGPANPVEMPPPTQMTAESIKAALAALGLLPDGTNDLLMGLGGPAFTRALSLQGGSTYGDVFLVNIDFPKNGDAAAALRNIVAGGGLPIVSDNTGAKHSTAVSLDRLLYHEEVHSRQWSEFGEAFGVMYIADAAATSGRGDLNAWEQQAGLYDGGYLADP